jgi:hypothetical protein
MVERRFVRRGVVMTRTDRISLPLGFDVPEGWLAVEPEAVGAGGAAFVAIRPDSVQSLGGNFTPTITVSVANRPDSASLLDIADEAVTRLGRTMAELDVLSRQEGAGEVTQVLRIVTPAGLELAQSQVHLVIPGANGLADRVVVELACTSTPQQAASAVGEFQRFVASFHVRSPAAVQPSGNNSAENKEYPQ